MKTVKNSLEFLEENWKMVGIPMFILALFFGQIFPTLSSIFLVVAMILFAISD